MKKTPAVAYCSKRMKTAGKEELKELIKDIPLNSYDFKFLNDIIEGLNNQELAEKHHKSQSRISQWKRSVFEQVHAYELHHCEWERNRKLN